MDFIISIMADALLVPIVVIAAVVILRLPATKRLPAIAMGAIVSLTSLWLATLASLFYQGTRPFMEQGVDPGASYLANPGFPSDHALLAFAATFVVYGATRNLRLAIILFVLSILVGLGRVLALVHAPIDVLGSLVCVAGAAFLWYGSKFQQKF